MSGIGVGMGMGMGTVEQRNLESGKESIDCGGVWILDKSDDVRSLDNLIHISDFWISIDCTR